MRRRIAAAAAASFLFSAASAYAHQIDEYLQATILSVQAHRVQASMRLIPGTQVAPSVIDQIDTNGDGILSGAEERAYAQRVVSDLSLTINGQAVQPKLVSWSFPLPADMRGGLGEIHIEYIANLPPTALAPRLILTNHPLSRKSVYLVNALTPDDAAIHILAQKRTADQAVYELDYEQTSATLADAITPSARFNVWLGGVQFSGLFHLGMRHIAEGTDHLLFLLTLLLPAPLLVSGGRWGPPMGVRKSLLRILGIVTAFTLGHSITLTLAALGALHIPSRPIEILIAVSIFVSALHALRPIVPGKEAWIAGFFGLIHGLAFAATLDRLGQGRWERVAGILAFNLGIEAMQMLVVALILPSLILLSRTSAYSLLRIGGALFAGVASLGWIAERAFHVGTPVDPIVNALAGRAVWIAVTLFLGSLASMILLPRARPLAPAYFSPNADR